MGLELADAIRPRLYRLSYIEGMVKEGLYPNARSLSADLGVSRRTILRDVEFMKDSLSAPLEYSAQKRGYYYTETEYSLGLLKLTEGELMALYLGHNLLAKCKGTSLEQSVISAFHKICCQLQEIVEIDFGRLADFITFDLEPLRGEEKQVAGCFAALMEAIQNKRCIKLTHYAIARDDTRERLVDPYTLRYYQGAWYLVGYCHLRKDYRFFALDRIRDVTTTGRGFRLREDFNIEQFMRDTFQLYKGDEAHTVKISFSPRQARWIKEKKWHPTQELAEQPDGSVILTMITSGLTQVKRWILSFGGEARALAPPALLQDIRDELAKAREMYI